MYCLNAPESFPHVWPIIRISWSFLGRIMFHFVLTWWLFNFFTFWTRSLWWWYVLCRISFETKVILIPGVFLDCSSFISSIVSAKAIASKRNTIGCALTFSLISDRRPPTNRAISDFRSLPSLFLLLNGEIPLYSQPLFLISHHSLHPFPSLDRFFPTTQPVFFNLFPLCSSSS